MEPISAVTNPESAVAASAQAIAAAEAPQEKLPPVPPPLENLTVELPGGYLVPRDGEVYTEAIIRELDGDDEEALARASGNFTKLLDTILQRGVVSVGPHDATKQVLSSLLMGDRDMLLVGIRRVTFGDEIEFNPLKCPSCGVEQEPTIKLSEDVPIRKLDDASALFPLKLKSGRTVEVTLPSGSVQQALGSLTDRTESAMNTEVLSRCVKSIDGIPVMSSEQVRKGLKIRERQEIIAAINDRNPGPQLGEVKRPCEDCGEDIPLPLNLAALFLN